MEWVESTGSSIDEAKERALDRLGVHGDDAEFEVISDIKTGLFGRVKEEARVRARVAPATPRAKEERRRGKGRGGRNSQKGSGGRGNSQTSGGDKSRASSGGNRDTGENSKAGNRSAGNRSNGGSQKKSNNGRSGRANATAGGEKREKTMSDDDQPTMPLPQQADLAESFVRGLAERFGTTVEFTREEVEDDEIRITVSGDDLGRMIGRRGTTAGAIDELVRTVLQRQAGSSRNGRIRVDVGGVRARRAEALAKFSREQAAEVRSSGTARSLEPMSAADRKIVHDALTDEEGVETRSEGEDNRRRVVIVPVEAGD